MASTSWHKQAPKAPLKLAISYGLLGGPAHSRRFRALAERAGFNMASLEKADIVIAHSAGCWLMPAHLKPRLVIYVGLPLTEVDPRQAWLRTNAESFRWGNIRRALRTKVLTGYYGLTQPRRNLDIIRNPRIGEPTIYKGVPAVHISNRYDPWPKAKALPQFIDDHAWSFISLPGSHDDIWEHPERYTEIIEYYAGLLA